MQALEEPDHSQAVRPEGWQPSGRRATGPGSSCGSGPFMREKRVSCRARVLRGAVCLLLGACLTACAVQGIEMQTAPASSLHPPTRQDRLTATPTLSTSTEARLTAVASSYGFPATVDPSARYLFYLHGKIVEDQGLPAISPEYGEYRYQEIMEALRMRGFVVISEPRARNTDSGAYALRVADQVTDLVAAGVPASSITLVGASKGAAIAAMVSAELGIPEVNYVLLGTCHPSLIETWLQEGMVLTGNVLAIRDVSDVEYSGSCNDLFTASEGRGLSRHDEILLQVGAGHGILYGPLTEWIDPTAQWAKQQW